MSLVIESDIEKYLVKQVRALGGRCIKFLPEFEEGMPDRIVILPRGVVAFAEVKRPEGGKLSAMQRYQIHDLQVLGCKVYVVKTKAEVDVMLGEIWEE